MKLPSNRPEDLLPEYEAAYEALPESYRADSCLHFYLKGDNLYADYDMGGTYVFHVEGMWVATLPMKKE